MENKKEKLTRIKKLFQTLVQYQKFSLYLLIIVTTAVGVVVLIEIMFPQHKDISLYVFQIAFCGIIFKSIYFDKKQAQLSEKFYQESLELSRQYIKEVQKWTAEVKNIPFNNTTEPNFDSYRN